MGGNDSKDKSQGLPSSSSSSSSSATTTMHVAGQITPAFVRKHYNVHNISHYGSNSSSSSEFSKRCNHPSLYNSRPSPRLQADASAGGDGSAGEVICDGLSNVLFLLQFACLDLRSTNYDKVTHSSTPHVTTFVPAHHITIVFRTPSHRFSPLLPPRNDKGSLAREQGLGLGLARDAVPAGH